MAELQARQAVVEEELLHAREVAEEARKSRTEAVGDLERQVEFLQSAGVDARDGPAADAGAPHHSFTHSTPHAINTGLRAGEMWIRYRFLMMLMLEKLL